MPYWRNNAVPARCCHAALASGERLWNNFLAAEAAKTRFVRYGRVDAKLRVVAIDVISGNLLAASLLVIRLLGCSLHRQWLLAIRATLEHLGLHRAR